MKSMSRKPILLGVTTLILSITQPAFAGRIVGNFDNPTDIAKYVSFAKAPETEEILNQIGYVLIFDKDTGRYNNCGAAVIDNYWIATSAHCVVTKKNDSTLFKASSAIFTANDTVSEATQIVFHKNFDQKSLYFEPSCSSFPCSNNPKKAISDIALIRFNRDITKQVVGTLPSGDDIVVSTKTRPGMISVNKPETGFNAGFIGWGRPGDGKGKNRNKSATA